MSRVVTGDEIVWATLVVVAGGDFVSSVVRPGVGSANQVGRVHRWRTGHRVDAATSARIIGPKLRAWYAIWAIAHAARDRSISYVLDPMCSFGFHACGDERD
jgi:hypothetical protein